MKTNQLKAASFRYTEITCHRRRPETCKNRREIPIVMVCLQTKPRG